MLILFTQYLKGYGGFYMSRVVIPKGYSSNLTAYETQTAIGLIKRSFEINLCQALNLKRASAPLFVDDSRGLNDNLNGYERPVSFEIKETGGRAEVVHSLAKWKRLALKEYGFHVGEGIYTDMNAIRRDEEMDNLHSIYVDQWDWERIITRDNRNPDFLKEIVLKIVDAICDTSEIVSKVYPNVRCKISRNVSFITTQELEDMYPELSPKERENAYVREHRTAFIMQIGDKLKSGVPHDGRAPDYDDWKLNGDIVMWNDVLECAFEVSSMGIRVDAESLAEQLKKSGCEERAGLEFHKMLLNNELPLTIGGGIGQSRLCTLLLGKAHIGEVQVSVWDEETVKGCEKAGIKLL